MTLRRPRPVLVEAAKRGAVAFVKATLGPTDDPAGQALYGLYKAGEAAAGVIARERPPKALGAAPWGWAVYVEGDPLPVVTGEGYGTRAAAIGEGKRRAGWRPGALDLAVYERRGAELVEAARWRRSAGGAWSRVRDPSSRASGDASSAGAGDGSARVGRTWAVVDGRRIAVDVVEPRGARR